MTSVGEDRQQVNPIEQGETADQSKGKEAKARCYHFHREGHFSRDSCCPARNAECQRCHKIGHFAKVCHQKQRIFSTRCAKQRKIECDLD